MSIKNKNNKLLKNGGLVTLRYFNDIDSVFVSSGSEEHLIQFNCVTDKVFQDISELFLVVINSLWLKYNSSQLILNIFIL